MVPAIVLRVVFVWVQCAGHLNNVGRCFQSERRLCDFTRLLMRVTSLTVLSGNDPNAIAFQAAILETDSTPVRNTAALKQLEGSQSRCSALYVYSIAVTLFHCGRGGVGERTNSPRSADRTLHSGNLLAD